MTLMDSGVPFLWRPVCTIKGTVSAALGSGLHGLCNPSDTIAIETLHTWHTPKNISNCQPVDL